MLAGNTIAETIEIHKIIAREKVKPVMVNEASGKFIQQKMQGKRRVY